ncbi:BrnA antitoxin family protein [Streptomyces sp. HNM0575]|uniref:BrnA antitoxin family protein n=1 Tax=Streptomyces sp. HNM0575 TaxID=2716338 RepID=UPI001F10DEC0|nr:BrnA antitoxin family protein [Streptomyces sp. HNM0575]
MTSTTSKVLSLRMDSDLFERLHAHAGKRGMSVQDYVVRALVRHDFDERLQTSVEETERFFGSPPGGRDGGAERSGSPSGPQRVTSRQVPARSGRA